jgi:hypothetical protein
MILHPDALEGRFILFESKQFAQLRLTDKDERKQGWRVHIVVKCKSQFLQHSLSYLMCFVNNNG